MEAGGGLFLQPQSVRYRGSEDELYWNAVFAPLGAKILSGGVFDKTRSFEGTTLGQAIFWSTRNIQAHAVTRDVSCLYLPQRGFGDMPGLTAMEYGPEWQVLVQGEKEAKSYRSNPSAENCLDLNHEGTYATAPPVLAERQLGTGRIVCYPISALFTGLNHRNPLWADIVECNGGGGKPSHSMKMQMNAYRWLAEPSRGLDGFGTLAETTYKPVQFPSKVDWNQYQFARTPAMEKSITYPDGQIVRLSAPAAGIRGIFGAHSAHSDGSGSVADYARAAKAAGLSFIVFADPLERLTKAALDKLKADCAASSKCGDFYACPGIEFTDGIGNRWAFWGETVVWPDSSFSEGTFTYSQWDGQRIHHYGQFMSACQYGGSALLDYQQFRHNGAHPENLWDFFDYLPLVYEKDRLIADNENEYLFGLRDLRSAAVASFTRVRSPADVVAAARVCFTGMKDLPSAKAVLNCRGAKYASCLCGGPIREPRARRRQLGGHQFADGKQLAIYPAVRSGYACALRFARRRASPRSRCWMPTGDPSAVFSATAIRSCRANSSWSPISSTIWCWRRPTLRARRRFPITSGSFASRPGSSVAGTTPTSWGQPPCVGGQTGANSSTPPKTSVTAPTIVCGDGTRPAPLWACRRPTKPV